jgi:type II secretory pathway pseudopilin PulG
MFSLFCFLLAILASPFKSKSRLEAENAALRHQLMVLRRKMRGRVRLTNSDRMFFIQLYRWFPSVLKVITVIRPETLIRWHRAGFRRYWRWKSRSNGGRPQIGTELRALIRQMSIENPLWGAPRIHGELLKVGLRSRSRASPNTWSSGVDSQVKDGTFSAEPRAGHCCDGSARCSDHWLRLAVCPMQRRDPAWINGVFSHCTVS